MSNLLQLLLFVSIFVVFGYCILILLEARSTNVEPHMQEYEIATQV